ncbi:hypothetical protein SLA2020_407930 [Shorea laevis]
MTSDTPGILGRQFHQHAPVVVPIDRGSGDRNVTDICTQTGEEFSPEFLRDRGALRRRPVTTEVCHVQPCGAAFNYVQNQVQHGRNVSDCVNGQQMGQIFEENYADQVNPGLTNSPIYAAESPQSYIPYYAGVMEAALSGKMKFLCSFGGRILPRPSDGKLRYVGGETRIISIRPNLTWEELARKTTAICNHPHIIKYQLPGEDLDALVSVCSNEDLLNMIEEYHGLERNGGSQRLRIFLISLGDPESPLSLEGRSPQQADTDYQYVSAVNGMLDMSPQNSRSQSLASPRTQLGNASDYSPIHKETPPSTLVFENKDYSPRSTNFKGILSNPAPQFLAKLYIPNKSFNQSPPLSPVQVQHGDPKNSSVHFYVDRQHLDCNGNINPFFTEKHLCDNSYYVDASRYHDNPPHVPPPLINYHHHNQHFLETGMTNKPHEMHFHSRSPSGDCVPYPLRGHSNLKSEISTLKEKSFSDSQLHGLDETSGYPVGGVVMQVSCNNGREEKSPSLALSNSPREWPGQWQDTADGKYQVAKHENQLTIGMADCKGNFELNQIDVHDAPSDQDRKQHEGDTKVISHYDSKKDRNLQNLNYLPSISLPAQNLVGAGDSVFSLPVSSGQNSADGTRDHFYDCQNTVESELCMRKQNAKRDDQCTRIEIVNGDKFVCQSAEQPPLQPQQMANQEANGSGFVSIASLNRELFHYLIRMILSSESLSQSIDNTTSRRDFLHGEEAVNCLEHNAVEVEIRDQSYNRSKFEDATGIQSKLSDDCNARVLEPMLIIEDVTNSPHPDIPSSSTVVPNIQDLTSDELQPTRQAESGGLALDSSFEDLKYDDGHAKESFGDAAMVEIEAGIYGLQIVKNEDLEELKELGSGTFGTVYHGKWRGTDVAIKRIKKICFSGKSSEEERLTNEFWREARILSNLHHPNVVAFYGVVPDGPEGTMATVTEYMVNGSLRNALASRDRALDRRKKLLIAMDAAFGMEYLHLKNIVHFDLKCDNLLVNLRDPQRPICKVGDFGLSRIKRNTLVSGGVRGTLPWMAPELLNGSGSRVSEKVDVFSFGVALWEILTGEEPYASMHCGAIIGGIVSNTLRPPIPERCDPEWRKLMEECWSFDPAGRPSFTEIANRLRVMSAALQPKRRNVIR